MIGKYGVSYQKYIFLWETDKKRKYTLRNQRN